MDLALVGDGCDRAKLAAYIRTRDMGGNVRLMGQREDIAPLMMLADLYVHASVFEGLPLVVLEAMNAGLPIVATPAPGVDEAIDDATATLAAAGRVPSARAVAVIGAPADPAHVLHNLGASLEKIETEGEAEVTLGGTASMSFFSQRPAIMIRVAGPSSVRRLETLARRLAASSSGRSRGWHGTLPH